MTNSAAHESAARMISLAGHVGSGKTTVARIIAERTGRDIFSTGHLFRQMAERMGMTVLQLNEYAQGRPEIDAEVDDHLRRLAAEPRPLVIDSRMAWFFVPQSYKVYLVVDPAIGGQRVHGAGRADEVYGSTSAAEAESKARERVEAQRYHDLYGVVRDDWRHYDLIVDTTHTPATGVVEVVLATLNDGTTEASRPRCFLSPRRLLPSRRIDPAETAITPGPSSPPVDVAVVAGHIVIVDGHRRVAAALIGGVSLVECNLVALEEEPLREGRTTARVFTTDEVTADGVASWEANHGFAFESRPPWLAGGGA